MFTQFNFAVNYSGKMTYLAIFPPDCIFNYR